MSLEPGRLMDHLRSLLEGSDIPGLRETAVRMAQMEGEANDRRARHEEELGVPVPSLLFVSLTTRCNLSCRHCYSACYPAGVDLPLAKATRVLQEAAELGIFICVITGGEPLLYPGLFDLLARHDRMVCLLFTNGTVLDDPIAARLQELRHVLPLVSIEGNDRANDLLRGAGTSAKVWEALTRLSKAGIPFGFSATACQDNLADLLDIGFYARLFRAGARFGIVLERLPVGQAARHGGFIGAAERAVLVRFVAELRRRTGLFLALLPSDESHEGGCQAARDMIHVNVLGQVEPCPFLQVSTPLDGRSLADALRSELFESVRRHSGEADPNGAVSCWYLQQPRILRELQT